MYGFESMIDMTNECLTKSISMVSATTREQILELEAAGTLQNVELYAGDRDQHKFSVGDRMELFGLEEYPELDGEIVVITSYRSGPQVGYYIKSESGNVERWLNFVWEKRLRPVDKVE